ncbi:gluconokinase [Microbacterium rhizomatis]|uniref:Gluconokinase n=2 Tax=Microbacterium rhizomatis TaxID=1631477 RepID=A0A5J5IX93_9MICO|nr:gluconokinase [Microbacterium rhizomatis]
MGVSAVGKSTVATCIAAASGFSFVDADELHPAANIAKMAAGVPLEDGDRWPWLDRVGATLAAAPPPGIVIACSALTRAYRDRIRVAAPDAFFVFLDGAPDVLHARAAARTGHFMPAALLDSQLALLEPLQADERGVRIDVVAPIDQVCAGAVAAVCADGRS